MARLLRVVGFAAFNLLAIVRSSIKISYSANNRNLLTSATGPPYQNSIDRPYPYPFIPHIFCSDSATPALQWG